MVDIRIVVMMDVQLRIGARAVTLGKPRVKPTELRINGARYVNPHVSHTHSKKINTQNVYSPCGHRFNLLEDVDWKGTIPEIPVRTGIISLRAVRLAISSIVLMHVLQMVMIVLRLSMIVMGIANFGDHFLS